ncbi:MAG: hypothetical protein CMJ75_15265 [Planctomycetaceae bacterium]|nr:hypothetical protein [Planctomycetaceae bacterium]
MNRDLQIDFIFVSWSFPGGKLVSPALLLFCIPATASSNYRERFTFLHLQRAPDSLQRQNIETERKDHCDPDSPILNQVTSKPLRPNQVALICRAFGCLALSSMIARI